WEHNGGTGVAPSAMCLVDGFSPEVLPKAKRRARSASRDRLEALDLRPPRIVDLANLDRDVRLLARLAERLAHIRRIHLDGLRPVESGHINDELHRPIPPPGRVTDGTPTKQGGLQGGGAANH